MKKAIKYFNENKSHIYNFILSIMAYTGINLYYGISNNLNYSFIFIILFIAILYFFNKSKITIDRKNKLFSLILGLLLTVVIVIGNIVNKSINLNNEMIFTLKTIINALVQILCLFPLFNRILNLFYEKLGKVFIKSNTNIKNTRKFFLFSWIFIFICYLPYLWRYFPGKLTYDSIVQLDLIKNGIFSDWHPFIHTQFVGLFYNIGNSLFHSETIGVGLYIIVQMIIMSTLFAYIVKFLYKNKVDIRICLIVLLCYALLPQYTHYSVTLWKDILFGGSFVLVFISLIEFALDNINLKQVILFVLGILMMLFFRNNGIYIVIFITPFIVYTFRKKIKLFMPLMVGLIGFYYIVKGPIYDTIGVSSTNSVEALSIPLQQIARVIALEKNVDDESLNYLNSIMDITKVKESYLPYISDPIKNLINRDTVEQDKTSLIKVWAKLLVRHPQIYIESYLSQTLGYWFTDVDYWTTTFPKNNSHMPNILAKTLDYTASKKVPLSNLFWSIGTGFILTLLSFSLSAYKKNKLLIAYIPFLGLWATMMIASPVYAEYRYVYGLFTCLPLILLLPFFNQTKKNHRQDDVMKKVLFIASTGGHLSELMQLKPCFENYNYNLITEKTGSTRNLINKFPGKVDYLVFGTKDHFISYIFKFSWNILKSLYLYFKIRPEYIVTTGTHTAVPICYIGKIFGSKIIFIETFANSQTKTLSGKLIYPISNLFIVQWEEMLKLYPKATYGGWIY